MQTDEYIRNLVAKAKEKLYDEHIPLSLLINECKLVAKYRGDYLNLIWLDLESTNLDKYRWDIIFSKYTAKYSPTQLEKLKKKFSYEWMREREITIIDYNEKARSTDPHILIYSVNEIETEIKTSREKRANATNISGMHELDKYLIETEKSKNNNLLIDYENGMLKVLSRIKNRIHEYLAAVELDLIQGKTLSSYFDKTKKYVDEYLHGLSPHFKEKLDSLDERLGDGTEIAFSQCLLTIRLILKEFADSLYPASSDPVKCSDGKYRTLSDVKYISRIWQYIFEQFKEASETSTEIMKDQIGDLGKRIELVYEKSCKGVHTSVTSFETYQCVILFYVGIADIIRLSSQE